jgi:RHS repeat-associated protein
MLNDFGGGTMPGSSLVGKNVRASLVKAARDEKDYRKAQILTAPPTGQVWRSYYFQGATRLALRVQVNGVTDKVYYLLADHLGSTTVSYRSDGGETRTQSYKPWGEVREGGNSLPTDRTFTGQRWEEVGLYYFNARWYDGALGRFVQADSVIPGGVQGLDRYAYVFNSPVRYTDPSGYKACDNISNGKCEVDKTWKARKLPLGRAQYQIKQAGYGPEAGYSTNAEYLDSYNTFVEVVITLGRVPTMDEILYMTAGTEYFILNGYSGVRVVGQEGLARNYYAACGMDGCTGNELYAFMSGYQPWFGDPGVMHDGSARARANHLINNGLRNNFGGSGDDLRSDVGQITNLSHAIGQRWTYGSEPNEPWQWFGPFCLNPKKEPSYGLGLENDAILSVDLGKHYVFWMFTYVQTDKFKSADWK